MCSVTEARRIVFYRTLAIDPESRTGSGVRPAKLLEAFRQVGYEVDVVAGAFTERKRGAEQVRQRIASGFKYDFLYAEPPTTPIPLNEAHHVPTHPLMDYAFLALCHRRGIPVILFYSDVQWRLPDYPRRVGWARYLAALPFFHLDLMVYGRVVDALLVPDMGMLSRVARWAEQKPHWVSIPGFDPLEAPVRQDAERGAAPLRLFYVGGVEPPVYDLAPLLRGSALAAARGAGHELTICCREPEWARRPASYDQYLGAHVSVVHNRTRQELIDLYARHDVAVMPYGTLNSDWAMPIKFPEAIGMGLPVLAGAGTAVARMAGEQGIGWSVGPSDDDLAAVLRTIDHRELERARTALKLIQPRYTWAERAREIGTIADGITPGGRDRVQSGLG
jgi:glycosyltransferase involved in cell wall biosynthesis